MINRVKSGLQTGADFGAVQAAFDCNITIGHCYMTIGFFTEDGPKPSYAITYNAIEVDSNKYPVRTRMNASTSDMTLWFGRGDSNGYFCTRKACIEYSKPFYMVCEGKTTPRQVYNYIENKGLKIINCAGSRESKYPGIEKRTYNFMVRLLEIDS